MIKWLNIIDPNVVKVGMQCRTCLDYDHPNDMSEDGDSEDPDDMEWFDAEVISIQTRQLNDTDENSSIGSHVIVRKKGETDTWNVFLDEDTVEWFLIKYKAWDD